jgi:hypothetical protein
MAPTPGTTIAAIKPTYTILITASPYNIHQPAPATATTSSHCEGVLITSVTWITSKTYLASQAGKAMAVGLPCSLQGTNS